MTHCWEDFSNSGSFMVLAFYNILSIFVLFEWSQFRISFADSKVKNYHEMRF